MTADLGTARDAAWRHDPDLSTQKPFSRRSDHGCFTDAQAVPEGKAVMLDTNFYIYEIRGALPLATIALVNERVVLHSGIALAELAISAGILDPSYSTTPAFRDPIEASLKAIDLRQTASPSSAAWAEAGMLSGILARTQLNLVKPKKELSAAERCCQDGLRRKLLNDALIFLSACEQGAVLVTSNLTDMDLLLRFRPDACVYAYSPVPRPLR